MVKEKDTEPNSSKGNLKCPNHVILTIGVWAGGALQPPQNLGNLDFFGLQEKFGQTQFLKKFACVCACCFFFEEKYFLF